MSEKHDTFGINKRHDVRTNLDRLKRDILLTEGYEVSYGDILVMCLKAEMKRRKVVYVAPYTKQKPQGYTDFSEYDPRPV